MLCLRKTAFNKAATRQCQLKAHKKPKWENAGCRGLPALSDTIQRVLRYFTSGESHGEALVAFLSGLPAGLKVDQAILDRELWRRQQGYGRGGRMKIETDKVHAVSGVRHVATSGPPIAI